MELKELKIIGISVRTANTNNRAAQDIGKLWQRFFTENIADIVPDKTSNDIYSVYTDYDSDYTGEYTTILGFSVNTLENIPAGLIGRQFPAENFTVFSAKGKMPDAVIDTWLEIWQKNDVLNRAYAYDFELYGNKYRDAADPEVDIYISVKG